MPLTLQKFIAVLLLILSTPLWPILYLIVKIDSEGPFIFKQKRTGKDMKPFVIYKIRTMVKNAEKIQSKYKKFNETTGPVFKIKNDPRYTKVGKYISTLALDELPQFINVIKGEMALAGPRPLPVKEALKIPKRYHLRFSVLPGMTSDWITHGSHKISFEKWMKLDLNYVKNKSTKKDLAILLDTFVLIAKLTFKRHGKI